jgi:hypothetical protein
MENGKWSNGALQRAVNSSYRFNGLGVEWELAMEWRLGGRKQWETKSEIPDHRSMFEDCVAVHGLYILCDIRLDSGAQNASQSLPPLL